MPTPPPQNITEVVFRGGTFFQRQVNYRPLIAEADILARISKPAAKRIQNVFLNGTEPVHLWLPSDNSGKVYYYQQVKALPFKCPFRLGFDALGNESYIAKHYTRGYTMATADDVINEKMFPWDQNILGNLYFMMESQQEGPGVSNCYLVCVKDKECFKIPYPNIFNTAKICMGDHWDYNGPPVNGNYLQQSAFFNAWTCFHTTMMNNHLLVSHSETVWARNRDNTGWLVYENRQYTNLFLGKYERAGLSFMTGWNETP